MWKPVWKRPSVLGAFAAWLVLGLAGSAIAEKPVAPADRRAEFLKRYDSDGDGKLSAQERRAAREAYQLERWDEDRDGSLSDEERGAARKTRDREHAERRQLLRERRDAAVDGLRDEERGARRAERKRRHQELLERYDADRDGRLSREEREVARSEGVELGRRKPRAGAGAARGSDASAPEDAR